MLNVKQLERWADLRSALSWADHGRQGSVFSASGLRT